MSPNADMLRTEKLGIASCGVSRLSERLETGPSSSHQLTDSLGARLRGRMATQRSKKGSEKVLGRVLGKGSCKEAFFYRKKGFREGFSVEKGFREGGFQKVPSAPPWRVRPR